MHAAAPVILERLSVLESQIRDLLDQRTAAAASAAGALEALLKDLEERAAQARPKGNVLDLAYELAGVAAYAFEIATNEVTWSPATYSLFGLSTEASPSVDAWLGAVHPDDRAEAATLLDRAAARGWSIEHTHRVVRPGGEILIIANRGRVLLDAEGRPERIIGVNLDITELSRAEAALRESEEEHRLTFDKAAVGVAHVEPSGRLRKVNRWLADFLGYTAAELEAMTFQAITFEEDLPADVMEVERLLAGEGDSYRLEKRYYRKDGEIVWASLNVALKRDLSGRPVHFVSVVLDIGAQKRAEERARLLIGELAHRTKNLMSVVQALLVLGKSETESAADLADAVSERLRGLSVSQDMFLAGDPSAACLSALLKAQLAPFVGAEDRRMVMEGPHVSLNEEAARALGLAIHELATNACKYGALSSPRGRVSVTWRLGGDDGERWVAIDWRESGGPPVREPTRSGFGRKVVERMIARSLNAEVRLDFAPKGFRWSARAPLSSLEMSGARRALI